jgi:TRAP-type transport system periplasmic protein
MDKEGKIYATAKGIKFIPLSQEEDARWAAKMKPIIEEYLQATKAKNLPGEEALKYCEDYLAKNQK